MVLTLNGIPLVSLELKNQLKGQDYECAINQYKNDRDPKEFCFKFNHRFLVYFAVLFIQNIKAIANGIFQFCASIYMQAGKNLRYTSVFCS